MCLKSEWTGALPYAISVSASIAFYLKIMRAIDATRNDGKRKPVSTSSPVLRQHDEEFEDPLLSIGKRSRYRSQMKKKPVRSTIFYGGSNDPRIWEKQERCRNMTVIMRCSRPRSLIHSSPGKSIMTVTPKWRLMQLPDRP